MCDARNEHSLAAGFNIAMLHAHTSHQQLVLVDCQHRNISYMHTQAYVAWSNKSPIAGFGGLSSSPCKLHAHTIPPPFCKQPDRTHALSRFGLKPDEAGNRQLEELKSAIQLVEDMMEAALQYVKSSPDWSYHESHNPAEIGMFFHAYPSMSVNSLHMHIVDMGTNKDGTSCCGPSFHHFEYKNLAAEQVLAVLKKELADGL